MSRCAAWSWPHPAVHEKTFRRARSVVQERDRPRGRAQGRVLLSRVSLSIDRAGVGLFISRMNFFRFLYEFLSLGRSAPGCHTCAGQISGKEAEPSFRIGRKSMTKRILLGLDKIQAFCNSFRQARARWKATTAQ